MRQLSLLTLILISFSAFCQTSLTGNIKPSDKFASTLYILKLTHIEPKAPVIFDSVRLNENGEFNYTFKNTDPQDQLYKIFLPAKNEGLNHTFGDVRKNFFYVSTENHEKIKISADADSLFYSLKIEQPGVNKSLLAFRDTQKPFYILEKLYADSIKLHPEQEAAYKQKAMPAWMSGLDKAKKKTKSILDTATNNSTLIMGLMNLYEASLGQLDSARVSNMSGR